MSPCVPVGHAVVNSVLMTLNASLIVLGGYTIYRFLKTRRSEDNDQKSPSFMFWAGIAFFLVVMIEATSLLIGDIHRIGACSPGAPSSTGAVASITRFLHVLQMSVLSLVLFVRINIVFMGSMYSLSTCTIYSVIAYFVLWTVLIIAVLISVPFVDVESVFMVSLLGSWQTVTLIYFIWIAWFFVYKLLKVYRHSNQQSEDAYGRHGLLAVITRITLLAMISMLSTFLFMLSLIYYIASMQGLAAFYLFSYMATLDVYTNFLCIAFSYKLFADYYYRCCGFCDRKCTLCCLCIAAAGRDPEKAAKTVMDLSVVSRQSSDTEANSPQELT